MGNLIEFAFGFLSTFIIYLAVQYSINRYFLAQFLLDWKFYNKDLLMSIISLIIATALSSILYYGVIHA